MEDKNLVQSSIMVDKNTELFWKCEHNKLYENYMRIDEKLKKLSRENKTLKEKIEILEKNSESQEKKPEKNWEIGVYKGTNIFIKGDTGPDSKNAGIDDKSKTLEKLREKKKYYKSMYQENEYNLGENQKKIYSLEEELALHKDKLKELGVSIDKNRLSNFSRVSSIINKEFEDVEFLKREIEIINGRNQELEAQLEHIKQFETQVSEKYNIYGNFNDTRKSMFTAFMRKFNYLLQKEEKLHDLCKSMKNSINQE